MRTILTRCFYGAALTLSVYLTSCVFPDPIRDLSPEEKDVYVTNHDKSVNFAEYQTYYIVDSVHVVAQEFGTTQESVEAAPLILDTINAELQKAGFQKVNSPNLADVGISVSVLKFSEDVPTSYYPYLGGAGYFGYVSPAFFGYPGYGYGFPPYYGYYQIDVGSISIEMFDLKSAQISSVNSLNTIWSAILAGTLASGTTDENNHERIVKAIQGAFAQSPYLKDGK